MIAALYVAKGGCYYGLPERKAMSKPVCEHTGCAYPAVWRVDVGGRGPLVLLCPMHLEHYLWIVTKVDHALEVRARRIGAEAAR